MLTKIKEKFQLAISAVASPAHKLGLTPNAVSALGFGLAILSACLYYSWHSNEWFLPLAAIFLLISGFCDALDGTLAKMYGQATAFGGFLDSTLDRLSEAIIFCSLILANPPLVDLPWGLTALVGSLLVSYTRARGEAVGVAMAAVGVAERAERILIIAIATFLGLVWAGIVVVAILSLLTVIQRIVHVYQKI